MIFATFPERATNEMLYQIYGRSRHSTRGSFPKSGILADSSDPFPSPRKNWQVFCPRKLVQRTEGRGWVMGSVAGVQEQAEAQPMTAPERLNQEIK